MLNLKGDINTIGGKMYSERVKDKDKIVINWGFLIIRSNISNATYALMTSVMTCSFAH